MKPNFALKLSHDGIEILQRDASGWILTGSSRFDVPDIDATMQRLRAEAQTRAPEGLRSKLIMPASEVRFATVMAPGPTDEARRLQIEAEIEGLTPYALHELAYDFVIEGDHALVALCAREIMAEAEDFAHAHGFNPVSFAALAPAGAFVGEPFFGETSRARALLTPGTRVERESRPTLPAARPQSAAPARPSSPPARTSIPPAASAAPKPPVAAPLPAVPGARAAAAAAATVAPEAFSRVGNLVRRMGTRIRREQVEAEQSVIPAKPPAAVAEKPAPAKPEAPPAKTPDMQFGKPAQPSAQPAQPVSQPPDPVPAPAKPATAATATPAPEPEEKRPAVAEKREADKRDTGSEKAAPSAASGPLPTATPPRPAAVPPAPPSTKPASPVAAPKNDDPKSGTMPAPVSFSSRRSTPTPAPKGPMLAASGPGTPTDKPTPGGRLAVLPAGENKASHGPAARLSQRSKRAVTGALSRIGLSRPAAGKVAENGARKSRTDANELPPTLVPASRPPVDERAKATEAESLTIFGARNMQRTETGFARRGLMFTGGLLLLLVAVAIWAVYFTSSPDREAEVAALPQEEVAALPGIEPPAQLQPPSSDRPDEADPVAAPPLSAAPAEDSPDTTIEAEPPVTDPEALLEELVQEALTEDLPTELLGRAEESAVEESALAQPPVEEAPVEESPVEESAVSASPTEQAPAVTQTEGETPAEPATDGTLGSSDSPEIVPESSAEPDQRLALPPMLERPQLTEVAPVTPPPPPPFGVEFSLGADGLVEATPEGALTPAGVMVYARPPAAVPPTRPAGLAPIPETPVEEAPEPPPPPPADSDASTAEGTDTAAVVPDDTPRADPALAGVRPQPRSPRVSAMADQSGASETEPAPADDPVTQTPEADDDSAALTPPPGGVSLDGLRPQRRPTDLVPPAETTTQTEAAEAGDTVIDDETAPEAVAVSIRPSARPSDLSARAQQVLAAAAAQQAAAPAAAAPAPAPAATATAAAPNIPTSASVAQQATEARAINLRRVNLIGVFGTPNNRRALVRLSNGQVVRVQVGDALDGGQVSAIGDDELRYVRNGRNEILRIGSSG